MKIAVVAAGAVGGYFGALLHASGNEVWFLARGAHLDRLGTAGLTLATPAGERHFDGIRATDDPGRIGTVDVVLFAVKLWDTEQAGTAAQPLFGKDTVLISLQNGVDCVARLSPILGAAHVTGGVAQISAILDGPGRIRQTGDFARIKFGEEDGTLSPRMTAFHAACKDAGIDAVLSETILVDRWNKFVFLVGLSGLTTLTRGPLGPILKDPDMRRIYSDCMAEVAAVGRAEGVPLADDVVERSVAFSDTMPPAVKASMLGDLENGKRLELDWLAGHVVARGRALGIPTPVNATILAGLKPFAAGTPAQ